MSATPRIALLACSVLEREIEMLAAAGGGSPFVETRLFPVGLHDRPDELRATLQAAIDELDAVDCDAIVLAYGLCGLATAGLRAGRHPLVIPRAHDCIAIFMGSKEAYAAHQREKPGSYYYSPGWNRERRVPGPERLESLKAEFAEKFDPEDVDFLLESERECWKSYKRATYIDLGTPDSAEAENYARHCSAWLGWEFERICGSPDLLRDLLTGNWDAARFLVVQPGARIRHSPDESILKAESGCSCPDRQTQGGCVAPEVGIG